MPTTVHRIPVGGKAARQYGCRLWLGAAIVAVLTLALAFLGVSSGPAGAAPLSQTATSTPCAVLNLDQSGDTTPGKAST